MSQGFLSKLKTGLKKTRDSLNTPISSILKGTTKISEDDLDNLEEILITADIGFHVTEQIIQELRDSKSSDTPYVKLRKILVDKLIDNSNISGTEEKHKPAVIMFVGVNGSGKTTTIGKMAHYYRSLGKSVILAAADTFRDAAIEQLEKWGERSGFKVIRHQQGADPSAVVFDAVKSARASKADYVLIDTAGRLHTKGNLMRELEKMQRVIKNEIESAPHKIHLVLDANTGQNGIVQAEEFLKTVNVTSIIVSKLDGTARAGFIFAIKDKTGLPVEYIGIGEKEDDLVPFEPETFVEALLT